MLLISLGHNVISVADQTASITDEAVLKLANTEQRILITNDLDFSQLVFHRRSRARGIILFRLRSETRATVHARLTAALASYQKFFPDHFITITDSHIRIRKLPYI